MLSSLEVLPATADQEPVLANLLELYAHDFSEFFGIELGEDGRFGYKALPLYWSEPGRHPFLVRVDGKLAGFVLVAKCPAGWDMAEFFVVRAYRRRGIGTEIAHRVWRRFPGQWEVRVMEFNEVGRRFWERTIAAFTGGETQSVCIERGGKIWQRFSFESTIEE